VIAGRSLCGRRGTQHSVSLSSRTQCGRDGDLLMKAEICGHSLPETSCRSVVYRKVRIYERYMAHVGSGSALEGSEDGGGNSFRSERGLSLLSLRVIVLPAAGRRLLVVEA
jgi:hypothetical protein